MVFIKLHNFILLAVKNVVNGVLMMLIFFSVASGIKSSGKALLPTMIINLTLQFRAYSKIGRLSATIKTFSLDSLTVVVNV